MTHIKEKKESAQQYWVVGAMYGGRDDMYETFIKRGYWEFGWEDKDKPALAADRNKILAGDRIAIKAMLGQGAREIRIRAIGIVKDNDHAEGRVYIDWLLTGMEREVPAGGCFGTLHGPYTVAVDNGWIGQVFRI
jgi:hypothetical protein